MTTYKEVFQSAQDKGYNGNIACDGNNCAFVDMQAIIKAGDTAYSFENGFYRVEEEDVEIANDEHWKVTSEALPEIVVLTLIAKWLRDEHKIVLLVTDFIKVNYGYKIVTDMGRGKASEIVKCSLSNNWLTYEEALLNGINAALKLIQL